jgi:CheY-like chemotaxis protein
VLDVRMPRLDGRDALPLLREECPGAKVALFTAFPEIVDADLVRSHDAIVIAKGAPVPWLIERLFALASSDRVCMYCFMPVMPDEQSSDADPLVPASHADCRSLHRGR